MYKIKTSKACHTLGIKEGDEIVLVYNNMQSLMQAINNNCIEIAFESSEFPEYWSSFYLDGWTIDIKDLFDYEEMEADNLIYW